MARVKAAYLVMNKVIAAFNCAPYPLKHSAILDSGSTIHIFNEVCRFLDYRPAPFGDFVYAGDSPVAIHGYGNVDIRVQGPQGPSILRLRDVAHCINFACNIVSYRQLRKRGYYWDTKGNNNHICRKDDSILCILTDHFDQYVLEYIDKSTTAAAFLAKRKQYDSWTKRPPRSGNENLWHLRLGHPGPEALRHVAGQSRGVKIKGISTVECDACGMAKVKRQVRRQKRVPPEKAGIRLAIDFHDISGDPGYTSAMLVTGRYSGYIWDYYLPDRTAPTLLSALKHLLRTLERQLQCKPEVIECDNEIPDSHQVSDFLSIQNGMRLEPSAPYTQSQNGGAERSGGVIKEKARAMRAGAKLPSFLWIEIWRAAVYLYNRTPKYIYNWKTPYERFYTYFAFRDGVVVTERKPDQTHLRVYGCKAFAMTTDALKKKNRRQRLDPRGWIGYLVGEEELIQRLTEAEVPQGSSISLDASTQEEDEELSALPEGLAFEREAASHPPEGLERDLTITQGETGRTLVAGDRNREDPDGTDHPYTTARFAPYLTPETCPLRPAALLVAAIREPPARKEGEDPPLLRAAKMVHIPPSASTSPGRDGANGAPRVISTPISCWEAAFNAGRLASVKGTWDGKVVTVSAEYTGKTCRTLALQLGGTDTFDVYSDASFADNTIDRKSSQAYVMKLFGGTIGWRANKQDTVTTSTTEAELLALAQAAKESMFISRLITELGVTLDNSRITIQCDNAQTIRLIHSDVALLQTKLRHVDIHNHWLRQEALANRISVRHTPTTEMIADGLTKALPAQQFQKFVMQVGLVDINDKIQERRFKELTAEDFVRAEEQLDGGRAE
ncbi:hypothetical protein FBEOM_5107 [Fusarium beomiforme]|uniref:Integrase catalytic domain-containing protein n=1 Tax=Fusarium beomiforme TaxID=44412 RepID=A0A9P5ALM8_9HYPO|nr:hypothetical protein FBEOM_5107 [Fusarium beomiforme]